MSMRHELNDIQATLLVSIVRRKDMSPESLGIVIHIYIVLAF